MSVSTMGWLADTLLYTGILIAFVLVLRRPVARYFGPNVAYMLWALPLIRFVLPPFVLPASMAPEIATVPVDMVVSDGMTSDYSFALGAEAQFSSTSDAIIAAGPVSAQASGNLYDFDLSLGEALLPIWLLGAAVLLGLRMRAYLRMRRDLLADARPAGEVGGVRLVETPRVDSPVAFGIIDKVIALPVNFMTWADVDARDLAIEHELSHHRGYDLVANIAAQPLLALHWFNPLAWWGWRAMRTDQEAACDARVVAGRGPDEKASYAEVIAGFAAGPNLKSGVTPNLGLVAPMACPVLGEKSIIQRLRSLSMNEVPTFRRRIGLVAIGAAGLALPMTASISYASPQADLEAVPLVPVAPSVPIAPLAPEPPIAPLAPDSEEAAVAPPAPPSPPAPPIANEEEPRPNRIIRIERTWPGEDDESHRIIHREFRTADDGNLTSDEHAAFEGAMAEIAAALEKLDGIEGFEGRDEMRVSVRMALAEAQTAMAEAEGAMAIARQNMPLVSVEMSCDGVDRVVERDLGNGRKAVIICQTGLDKEQMEGLSRAHREMEHNRHLSEEIRANVLREIEQRMEQLENRRQVSHGVISHSISIRVS